MDNKYNFEDITNNYYSGCLTEEDFYPPHDNRRLKSNIKDIVDGDNFVDYCEYIFHLLEEEGYYE